MGKHQYINLSQNERAKLDKMMRTGREAARKQTRARILLLSDRSRGDKRTGQEVAQAALCSVSTVRRICSLYFDGGLALALNDKGWPGAKPKLTGELEAQLTMVACSDAPPGHARWTLRLLANELVALGYVDEVSHVTVREWLKKMNLSLGA